MNGNNDFQNDELLLFNLNNMPSSECRKLYHYTSPEGLFNIIKTKKLWFTRYDCLNDYTEREYILEVLKSVCQKMKKQDKIDELLYNELMGLTLDKKEIFPVITDILNYESFDSEYYVCCFSKERDSLPMWNYYSKKDKYEGYNLEFSTDIIDYGKNLARNCNIKCFDIIYDRDEQEKIIEGAIEKLILIDEKGTIEIKEHMLSYIKTYALKFKNECFKHENETRIVLAVPKDGNEYFPIKYRVSNGNIIQYIEYEFDERNMTGLTIGPLVNAEVAQSTLWQFLKHNNYRFDDIKISKIPIRY